MEFNVGIIKGENLRFASRTSWPSTKLTIERDRLTLTTGFDSLSFDKAHITRLSEYSGFCWLFAHGIQIEHTDENLPGLFVFWAFDLKGIRRSLAENGFVLAKTDD